MTVVGMPRAEKLILSPLLFRKMNGARLLKSVCAVFPRFLEKSSANFASLVAFFKSAAEEVAWRLVPNIGLAACFGVGGGRTHSILRCLRLCGALPLSPIQSSLAQDVQRRVGHLERKSKQGTFIRRECIFERQQDNETHIYANEIYWARVRLAAAAVRYDY